MPTIRFVPAGMLTLRASVVPLEETYEWRRSSAARVDGRPSEWLLSTLDDPLFREAIVVASRDLPGRLIALREEILGAPGGSINRDAQRALQSWARYAMRAIGRPTPYGLFAGVALCGIGDEDSLYLSTQHCRCVQLDAWVLDRLVNEIARDLRTCLSYVPNSTLYTCGGQWRFTERLLTATGRVTYDLAAVDSSPELACLLDLARADATYGALVDILVRNDITREEAREFVDSLIDAQVLLPDLLPSSTDADPLTTLRRRVDCAAPNSVWSTRLREFSETIGALESTPAGSGTDGYSRLWAAIDSTPGLPEFSTCVDVTLHMNFVSASVDRGSLERIVRALEVLAHLRHTEPQSPIVRLQREIDEFRKAFVERYENATVPLCLALDSENGIGFGGGWAALPAPAESPESWRDFEDFFYDRIQRALASDEPIELTADDLRGVTSDSTERLCDAYSALVRIAPSYGSNGISAAIGGVGGPNPAMLVGRFAGLGTKWEGIARDLAGLTYASNRHAVQAELRHTALGRSANVVRRPVLSEVEIQCYSGESSAAVTLRPSDLTLQVDGERLVLVSPKLGCEIVPRLTSAHAAFQAAQLPVYRFLYGLGLQGQDCYLTWNWRALRHLPRLPRVSYDGIVLARARWRVLAAEFWRATESLSAMREFRHQHRLPEIVSVVGSDDEFPVDLENEEQLRAVQRGVAGGRYISLQEVFPFPAAPKLPDNETTLHLPERVIELVVPVRNASADAALPIGPAQARSAPVIALPGSHCWFAKLYSGEATADSLLIEVVKPLLEELKKDGLVDRWFFIRYADSWPHIRLRIFSPARTLHGKATTLLNDLCASLVTNSNVWRIQIDTYRPEVDRYGGMRALCLAERLFQADSEAVLHLLTEASQVDDRQRHYVGVASIHSLLSDFGISIDSRIETLTRLRRTFAMRIFRGHSADTEAKKHQAMRFRERRALLADIIRGGTECGLPKVWHDALCTRSRSVVGISADLDALAEKGESTQPTGLLLDSYIHMCLNRIFRSQHAVHEFDVYDMLTQAYRSEGARLRVVGQR